LPIDLAGSVSRQREKGEKKKAQKGGFVERGEIGIYEGGRWGQPPHVRLAKKGGVGNSTHCKSVWGTVRGTKACERFGKLGSKTCKGQGDLRGE